MSKTVPTVILELNEQLIQHSIAYYVNDAPTIPDYDYDLMFEELKEWEERNPDIEVPNSIAKVVGGFVRGDLPEIPHTIPMLSLTDIFEDAGLVKFHKEMGNDTEYCCEAKMDGLATSLLYVDGELVQASTRGDGMMGEDVTANAKAIASIPNKIVAKNLPKNLIIRGEVFMSRRSFERNNRVLREAGKVPFVNPRNAAAGAYRNKDSRVTFERGLDFQPYGIIESLSDESLPTKQSEILKLLTQWGFTPNHYMEVATSVDDIRSIYDKFISVRDDLPFDIDGLVVKVNDLTRHDDIGYKHRAPKWAIAYKFPAMEMSTTITAVDFQVSRTGTLTPVARLEPVFIAGVTVTNATLHNVDEIKRLNIGVGDRVIVRRAGDVVPQIVGVISHSDGPRIEMPEECPVCSSPVAREEGIVAIRCTGGEDCPPQLVQSIVHFVSRGCMDIDDIADESIEQLIGAGLLRNELDLYRLQYEDLVKLEGWGDVKAKRLLSNIEKAKFTTYPKFLRSIDITGLGDSKCVLIADQYPNIEDLMIAKEIDLVKIKDIGPKLAKNIARFFWHGGDKLVNKLISLGVHWNPHQPPKEAEESWVKGKTFCITGSFEKANRKALQTTIKEMGGKVTGSVSKKTDFLIAGDGAGGKLDDATKLGIKILGEEDIKDLI